MSGGVAKMSYAIDEMAPIMWVFIIILGLGILIAILHFLYVWVAEDPCRAYDLISTYWGRVGDHCVG